MANPCLDENLTLYFGFAWDIHDRISHSAPHHEEHLTNT